MIYQDMARSVSPPGLVALAATQTDEEATAVRGWLQKRGYRVQEFSAQAVDTIILAYPAETLAAVFVLAPDPESGELSYDQRLQTAFTLGAVASQVGPDRTMLLIEGSLATLLGQTGVRVVRFQPGQIENRLSELEVFLQDCDDPRMESNVSIGGHLPFDVESFPSGRILGSVLAVAAVMLMMLIYFLVPWSTVGFGSGVQADSGPGAVGQQSDGTGVDDPPAAEGKQQSVTCSLDLANGMGGSDIVSCADGAYLQLIGFRGPWPHLAAIRASSGVSVTAMSGQSGERYLLAELTPTRLATLPENGGLTRIDIQFESDGQTLRLRTPAESGGNETLIVFRSGR